MVALLSSPPVRRPLLRGYAHLLAALVAPFALLALLLAADSPRAYVGGALFGAALILLFSTSATYHVVSWGSRGRAIMRRLDHAMIFVAMAGLYAPFCLQAMHLAWGIPILCVVGGLALVGVVLKVVWIQPPQWVNLACYLAVGWVAIVAIPAVRLEPLSVVAVVASGLLFTAGGVCFASRRPRLFPRIFGHHEVFHVAVVMACALLYVVVLQSVLPG